MRWGEEGVGWWRGGPGHLVTGGLSWRDTPGTTSTLFIMVIYGGHRQADLSWLVQQPQRKYNYQTKAQWRVAISAFCSVEATLALQNASCAEVGTVHAGSFSSYSFCVLLDMQKNVFQIQDILEIMLRRQIIQSSPQSKHCVLNLQWCGNFSHWGIVNFSSDDFKELENSYKPINSHL